MKIAVFGTGSMGKLHAAIYKSFRDIDSVIIVGRDETKTKEIAQKLGVKWSTEQSKVFGDSSITAVDVCFPTELHKEFVISALERGKHVFCEIPIAFDLKEAEEMLDKARSAGKVFQIAQLMRSIAEVSYVAEKVKSCSLGKILSANFHRFQRYKVAEPIIDLMGFELDEANYLFGLPKNVLAIPSNRVGAEEFTAMLNYSGFSSMVEFKTIMSPEFPLSHGVRVVCSDGIIETNTVFTIPEPEIPETSVTFYPRGGKKEEIKVKGHDPYEYECRYFIDTILGSVNGELLDAEHAVSTLKMALAVKKSLAIHERVEVEDGI